MNLFRNITPLQWIGVVILFNTTLIGGSSQLSDLFLSPGVVKALLAVATLGNGFLGGLVTMFGGQAAMLQNVQQMPGIDHIVVNGRANATLAQMAVSEDNPKIEATPASASLVAKVAKGAAVPIMLVLVGFILFTPYGAWAQTARRPAAAPAPQGPVFTGDLATDVKNGFKGDPNAPNAIQLTGNFKKDAQAVWDKIVAASNADLKYASQLAANANTPSSAVRKQCWDAIVAINEQANGLNLKDTAGNLIPEPDPKLFTQIEQAAEVIDALSPQGKLYTSCAGAAQLAQANVIQFISAALGGVAGLAKLTPIPGL